MITDALVRDKFVHDTLSEGIRKIHATQEQTLRSAYHERTGQLRASLSARRSISTSQGHAHTFYVRALPYLRFLDMAYRHRTDRLAKYRRAHHALYNRVVWGVLYHETFPELTYGFTDEVRARLGNELREILETTAKHTLKKN